MNYHPAKIAMLLFGSGFCALVYQIAWLRMLRLVFGSSTLASSAVLAIFMGGLGAGAWWLGSRVDQHKRPLRLYAKLELGVTLAAALSPFLILLIQKFYIMSGGTMTLGKVGGTLLRLFLASLVLGIPTFFMGATLPAAIRTIERRKDQSRRLLGLIYGSNTMGAVCGAFLTNFFGLEIFGVQMSLWLGCLLNLLIVMFAFSISRQATSEGHTSTDLSNESGQPAHQEQESTTHEQKPHENNVVVPGFFVIVAAATVGFAFFVMELVWYRMLSPILGGSSYTFGLILAVALLGVGLGGLCYSIGGQQRRLTLWAFAVTCVLEALCLIIPYALGDDLAYFAVLLRQWGNQNFASLVLSWSVLVGIVVFPAALVSGYQFPLLVSLLGVGEKNVGREVGVTYAANTIGAIVGALLGGFFLIPRLTAPGTWFWISCLLLFLALAAAFFASRQARPFVPIIGVTVLGVATLFLSFSTGPSSFWRHSPIGVGRYQLPKKLTPNVWKNHLHKQRRSILWQADGVESSIGLNRANGYAFYVNGKSDGHARFDAPTQVLCGLIGSALHPNPKRVLVIGLGTGSTAGWLAQVPSVTHVDVVELEPVVKHMAKLSRPVNYNVLTNPKIRMIVGDAREALLTLKQSYDLIISEPSNPYRAGISSLFSEEFYAAVKKRLHKDGLFVQWLQLYDVRPQTVYTVYATLAESFPAIETWEVLQQADLLLVSGLKKWKHNPKQLKQRLRQHPYHEALLKVWGVAGIEGFYSGYVGSFGLSSVMVKLAKGIKNTDDYPFLEFEFARSVGDKQRQVRIGHLRDIAEANGVHKPPVNGSSVNWARVREMRAVRSLAEQRPLPVQRRSSTDSRRRQAARRAYLQKQMKRASQLWKLGQDKPLGPADRLMVAHLMLMTKHPKAKEAIAFLKVTHPIEHLILQAYRYQQAKQSKRAIPSLLKAFRLAQTDPWFQVSIMSWGLQHATFLTYKYPKEAESLFKVLHKPFAVRLLDHDRMMIRLNMSHHVNFQKNCLGVMASFEPHIPWSKPFLKSRLSCYKVHKHKRYQQAKADLELYQSMGK